MSKLTKRVAEVCVDGFQPAVKDAWKYKDVYLASDVDAHLATQGERILELEALEDVTEAFKDHERIADLQAEVATLQAELADTKLRRSETVAMCDQLRGELEGVRSERDEARLESRREAEEKIHWQFQYSLVPDWVRDCLAKHISISNLTQQLAAREEQVKDLEEHQQLHDRIFARQKFLLEEQCKTITRLEGVVTEAVGRLEHSSHSEERPEPYESRTPVIRAYLQDALKPSA